MVKNTEIKKEIRRQALERRGALSPDFREKAGREIADRVLSSELFGQCGDIFCYVSFRDEADTYSLICRSLEQGHRVAVPKVMSSTAAGRKMEFYYINSMDELKPGAWGIPEPDPETAVLAVPDHKSLVIMPGAAFDRTGRRLGYGGGYYDTYLRVHPGGYRIALAYSVQILDTVPAEPHDVRPEIIFTENECIVCDRLMR